MKKMFIRIVCAALAALLTAGTALAADVDIRRLISAGGDITRRLASLPDGQAFCDSLANATGVVVFPELVQGALGFGGLKGAGMAFERGEKGKWTGPNIVSLFGVSLGFHFAIQRIGMVMVVEKKNGMGIFFENRGVIMGRDIDIADGFNAAASGASVKTFAIQEGVSAGIEMTNANIAYDADANKAYWNDVKSPGEIRKTEADRDKLEDLLFELDAAAKAGKKKKK